MQHKKLSLANFSERLRAALENRGLKPTPLAKKLGISSGYLSELLQGTKANPSLETLRKLSGELGCDLRWLETGEPSGLPLVATNSGNPKEYSREAVDNFASDQGATLREEPTPYKVSSQRQIQQTDQDSLAELESVLETDVRPIYRAQDERALWPISDRLYNAAKKTTGDLPLTLAIIALQEIRNRRKEAGNKAADQILTNYDHAKK